MENESRNNFFVFVALKKQNKKEYSKFHLIRKSTRKCSFKNHAESLEEEI